MNTIQTFGIPALTETYENYIWALVKDNQCWIIDPGEAEPVLNFLKARELTPQGILITHRHADHINGVKQIKKSFNDITVYGPEKTPFPLIDQRLKEGDSVTLFENYKLQVLDTPGHTEDHISFYNDQHLFCGDTLFTAGCGRILGGTPEDYANSIMKINQLPEHLKFFCAHEYTHDNLKFARLIDPENSLLEKRAQTFATDYPNTIIETAPSTLEEEKQTNPFMRFHQGSLHSKLATHLHKKNSDTISLAELFATLRGLKDEFDQKGKFTLHT